MEAYSIKYSAPGKIILFGEHAVVYGHPAIATAIGLRASSDVQESTDGNISLSVPIFPNECFEISEKKNIPAELESFRYILLKLSKHTASNNVPSIRLSSTIPSSSGLGSSAATAVSLTASILAFYGEECNLQTVNDIAFEAEQITHGTPSGIDNAISTYGGGIIYENGSISKLSSELPASTLLIIESGVQRQTKKIVEKVRKIKDRKPQFVNSIFDQMAEITYDAKKNIESGDIVEVGQLMNKNNELLEKLGVGIPEFKGIIKILDKTKVLGRKITGAGGGGCLISLYEEQNLVRDVVKSLTLNGYKTHLTKIFELGVKYEQ